MKPPPPTPHENGSVTPSTPAAVTAASTALPPLRAVAIAAWAASRSTVAAAPPFPVEVGGPTGATVGADPAAVAVASAQSAIRTRDAWRRITIRIAAPGRIQTFSRSILSDPDSCWDNRRMAQRARSPVLVGRQEELSQLEMPCWR